MAGREGMPRETLRGLVGDESQFAGVRRFVRVEGRAGGASYAETWNAAGLRFTVALDRALDISDAFFGGRSLCWRSPSGDASPALYDPQGLGWLKTFSGGLLATCGLTHAGGPADVEGTHYGLHGPISNTPADEVSCSADWFGDEYIITISGKVRQARLFGEKLMMHREIKMRAFDKSISITDRVENGGHEAAPFMILYHINAGWPVIEEGSRLLVNAAEVEPATEHARDGMEDYYKFGAPTKGYAEKVYFITPKADGEGRCEAAAVNRARDFGLAVRWRHKELGHLVEWKQMGWRDYVVGIEPCNTFLRPRRELIERGEMPHLEAGERKEFHVEIAVLDGRDDVEAFAGRMGS